MNRTYPTVVETTDLRLPGLLRRYQGKVRDVYTLPNDLLVMVATDRISAFDVILPIAIPLKGGILNTIAAYFLEATRHIVPNWLLSTPDGRVSIGHRCEPFKVEMVVRGALCGHALRQYTAGARVLSGAHMPDGLRPYGRFPEPIVTPTIKAEEGHDLDISPDELLAQGLVPVEVYPNLEKLALLLFAFGQSYALSRGLILADTKYEFGIYGGQVTLMDEIHTPDSSRYYYADTYDQSVEKGETPKQLSKEFVREWLMANGFMGREGDSIPLMGDAEAQTFSDRYRELFRVLMGKDFDESSLRPVEELERVVLGEVERIA